MLNLVLKSAKQFLTSTIKTLEGSFRKWIAPAEANPLVAGVADLTKSKAELIAEITLLRQQLLVLNRNVDKPKLLPLDRLFLVFFTSLVKSGRHALLIVKPATLLKLHRAGYKLFWKYKSKPKNRQPRISQDRIALIRKIAAENPLWGVERIKGELKKPGIKVAKRTIQKYMRQAQPAYPPSQNWHTFLKNHATQVWAYDFLPVTDIFFRQLYAFVIVELSSRKIIQIGVTRHPTDEWTAQQLREATPFEQRPKYLIRDNDTKFGYQFKQVAEGTGIKVLKTPIKAPYANGICERLMGTLRPELLDHFLIFSVNHLGRVLNEFKAYYNQYRPHQGIGQTVPVKAEGMAEEKGKIISIQVLGGLHHHYQRVA